MLRVRDWWIQFPIFWSAVIGHAAVARPEGATALAVLAGVSLVELFVIAGAYTFNDLADLRQDEVGGKQTDSGPSRSARLWLTATLTSTGMVLAWWLFETPTALVLISLQAFFGYAYSAQPIRLKERGVLGVLTAASMQRLPPFLMCVAELGASPLVDGVLAAWLLVFGFIMIVEHQIADLTHDTRSGTRTFVRSIGPSAAGSLRARLYGGHVVAVTGCALVVAVLAGWPGWWGVVVVTMVPLDLGRRVRRYYRR